MGESRVVFTKRELGFPLKVCYPGIISTLEIKTTVVDGITTTTIRLQFTSENWDKLRDANQEGNMVLELWHPTDMRWGAIQGEDLYNEIPICIIPCLEEKYKKPLILDMEYFKTNPLIKKIGMRVITKKDPVIIIKYR